MTTKPYIIIVSGPQGSGKSTQAERLAARYNMPMFESGEELRQLVEKKGPDFETVADYMSKGQLVPSHFVDRLFQTHLDHHLNGKGIVSDGYPRNLDEVRFTESLANDLPAEVIGVYISLPEAVALERIAKRLEIKNGQATKRADDTPAAIRQRLATFHDETMPVLSFIRDHHHLIEIDGSPSADEVSEMLYEAMDPILKND